MESRQPRNRLREKCGYVYGSIRSITGERPDVYAFGTLPTDATFMTGRFERQTGVAESFAPHVLQGKGFLLCMQFVHPFRGLMRDSRFP